MAEPERKVRLQHKLRIKAFGSTVALSFAEIVWRSRDRAVYALGRRRSVIVIDAEQFVVTNIR